MNENKKTHNGEKIVIVSGDGTELDISEVHDHINIEESKNNSPEKDKIVIPPQKGKH